MVDLGCAGEFNTTILFWKSGFMYLNPVPFLCLRVFLSGRFFTFVLLCVWESEAGMMQYQSGLIKTTQKSS
jgi:hypothetical protein